MLTLFSVPKPFRGHTGIIQRNAIESWTRLSPRCEIILFADDPGTREVAAEFGARHLPDVARNEYGTPLLNSVFEEVEKAASHDLLCYVNADIILTADFLRAVEGVARQKVRFLMAGQRWDVDIREPLDFGPSWEEHLLAHVARNGRLHPETAMDYFVFPRRCMVKLLPFAVGRPGWDNWFIYRTRKLGIPVVDVTRVVTVAHQNHEYAHVPNRRDETYEGPEADRNRELIGGSEHMFSLSDATHVITPKGLQRALGYRYLRRRLRSMVILAPGARPLVQFVRFIRGRLRSRRNWRPGNEGKTTTPHHQD
jgi:hypothetical protein